MGEDAIMLLVENKLIKGGRWCPDRGRLRRVPFCQPYGVRPR
jgi:hypothetical protein